MGMGKGRVVGCKERKKQGIGMLQGVSNRRKRKLWGTGK